ncbi:MAG: hypothetical protein J0I07_15400, partial [Myxococcales bacterium]|nr:hypothetical protein [Myxococcales bacterium]
GPCKRAPLSFSQPELRAFVDEPGMMPTRSRRASACPAIIFSAYRLPEARAVMPRHGVRGTEGMSQQGVPSTCGTRPAIAN